MRSVVFVFLLLCLLRKLIFHTSQDVRIRRRYTILKMLPSPGILAAAACVSEPNLHPDAIAAAAKVQSDQAAGDGRTGQSG